MLSFLISPNFFLSLLSFPQILLLLFFGQFLVNSVKIRCLCLDVQAVGIAIILIMLELEPFHSGGLVVTFHIYRNWSSGARSCTNYQQSRRSLYMESQVEVSLSGWARVSQLYKIGCRPRIIIEGIVDWSMQLFH